MLSAFPLPLTESLAVRTHCPYCAYQCGVIMDDQGDEESRLLGDPHFPVNNGQMCIKGWTAGALLRHPRRVTTPMLRDASRRWKSASWDAALDFCADRIRDIQARHGPGGMGVFGSGALTNEKVYLLGKFARIALKTPFIDYNGRYCMSSGAAAGNKAFGLDRGMPFPVEDIERAEVILLVGANVADTLPPIVQWFQKQKAAGGKLVVIDPRRTATARLADLHLAPAPGTDVALALGMMFVALEENLIDRQYVANRTTGFEAAKRAALQYHPAQVERLTGVSERELRRTTRWLAQARSAMCLSGRGPEQQSKGVDTGLAFINFMLAVGKVGKPASGYGTLTGQGNGQGGREHGQKADQLPGYRLIEVDAHRAAVAEVWGVDPAELPRKGLSAFEMLDALGTEGGPKGMVVVGSNIVVASPDSRRVEERVKGLEFMLVCDAFENETSEFAHAFLPVYQWAEEDGTMTNFEGRVIRRRQVAYAPPGVRGDIDVLRELADRLGSGDKFAFHRPRDVFEELRRCTSGAPADYAGITYERIDVENGVFWPCPDEDHPGTPRPFAERFHHPDGRAKFHAVEYRPAGEVPDAEYPLYLTTGRYKEHYNSGAQTRQVAKLNAAKPVATLQMHPRVAKQHGAVSGSRVVVESRRARVEFAAEVTPDIRPDTLFAPFHWGGRNAANALVNPALDPTSRMPEFKVCAVRIVAVRAGTPVRPAE